ncbi:hypothetical protein HJC23_006053 [Cyclotella cryptica]|uniref:ATP-dependent helicase HrpB n=1 Tax=Cyclotella cryptica TaxID=29204 RepID=A0ABD3PUS3_9STRA|eukprot:CCRYP_011356-RA/>CCRYP_011356-RA protein AED:0.25 eAED:0.25 QI:0/-1/0/1/-1/1/1/0/980
MTMMLRRAATATGCCCLLLLLLLTGQSTTAFTPPTRTTSIPRHRANALLPTASLLDQLPASTADALVAPLPISAILDRLQTSLQRRPNVLLQAPPGAGKTTIVPLLLSSPGLTTTLLVQPRRAAARSAAARMSTLLGRPVGETVGYAVRGESRQSSRTDVLVVTDGVLLRLLREDPELTGVAVVVLDEFHERGVGSDTALALLREVQDHYRRDLKIVVMSATLLGEEDAQEARSEDEDVVTTGAKLKAVLGGDEACSVLRSEGRQYPITIQHANSRGIGSPLHRALVRDTQLLVQTMANAIEEGLSKAPGKGDVLAFLPGAKEIRMTVQELNERKLDVEVLPLYGALSKAEQDRAIVKDKSSHRRRVIVSSPTAEASLTIDGVTCVVDSGLQRQPRYDVNTGLPRLVTVPCSRDSAVQRAGRAGRTQEGYCIRIYSEAELDNLPMHATPEIRSTDLVPTALLLSEWGCTSAKEIREDLQFVDPPPEESLAKAYQMLVDLGALEEYTLTNDKRKRYKVTNHGKQVVSLATHPRFATAIIRATEMGESSLAAAIAVAALTEDVIVGGRDTNLALSVRDLLREGPHSFNGSQLLSFAARISNEAKLAVTKAMESSETAAEVSECMGSALLPGFVDLIAQRKGEASYGGSTYMLALGQSARLDGKPDEGEHVIVVDTSTGDDGKTRIRSYCKIDASTLRQVAIEKDEVYAAASKGYEVRKRRVLKLGALILSSTTLPPPSSEEVADVLLDTIESLGGISALLSMQPKKDALEIEELLYRLSLAQKSSSDDDWPACFSSMEAIFSGTSHDEDEKVLLEVIKPWLGATASLKGLNLLSILHSQLSPEQQNRLDNLFPTKITAADGSIISITYNSDTGPLATAKLQQFFGQLNSPIVGPPGKSIAVTVSLLSPSGKPLAQTIDLPFFWKEVYPSVRAEMRGRYPKHPWPEDPLTAVATRMTNKQVIKSSEAGETDKRKDRSKQRKKR